MYNYSVCFLILLAISCTSKSIEIKSKEVISDSITEIPVKIAVNESDFELSEEDMGIGDDGIYNFCMPVFSSNLTENNKYKLANLSDYNQNTAWVSDKSLNDSILLNALFEHKISSQNDTLYRIDNIFVMNGYRKSKEIWNMNSRVKSFLISLNGKNLGIVKLQDTFLTQIVDLSKFHIYAISGTKLDFKFKFIEFYDGIKYPNEVAISEIEFSGTRLKD